MSATETDMISHVHNLQRTGLSREQAESIVRVVRDVLAEVLERALTPVYGRMDVLERRMDVLEQRMDVVATNMATKNDVAGLRREMAASEKRMVFAMLVGFVAIITAIVFG